MFYERFHCNSTTTPICKNCDKCKSWTRFAEIFPKINNRLDGIQKETILTTQTPVPFGCHRMDSFENPLVAEIFLHQPEIKFPQPPSTPAGNHLFSSYPRSTGSDGTPLLFNPEYGTGSPIDSEISQHHVENRKKQRKLSNKTKKDSAQTTFFPNTGFPTDNARGAFSYI